MPAEAKIRIVTGFAKVILSSAFLLLCALLTTIMSFIKKKNNPPISANFNVNNNLLIYFRYNKFQYF